MIQLIAEIPDPKDATSFYRGAGPIGDLKRMRNDLQVSIVSEYSWYTLHMACDILFLQRPFSKEHLKIVEMAKTNGKKIWLDYDDNLFAVPLSNRSFDVYSNPIHRLNMQTMIKIADVVTVTTTELCNQLKQFNPNIRVIPNAYPNRMFKHLERNTVQSNTVNWRGSDTHSEDLETVQEQLIQFRKMHPNYVLNFMGCPSWRVLQSFPTLTNLKRIADLDIIEFWHTLKTVQPKVSIVPLVNNVLNASKSNIAFLESAWAGAPTLAPDMLEWRHPGILNYNTPAEFLEILNEIALDNIDCMKIAREGWQYVQENLLLSNVNKLRSSLIDELMSS
jgi:hypothetical protein